MKVKVISRYKDLQKKKVVEKDAEFEVSEERAAALLSAGVAEVIEEANTDKKTSETDENNKEENKAKEEKKAKEPNREK